MMIATQAGRVNPKNKIIYRYGVAKILRIFNSLFAFGFICMYRSIASSIVKISETGNDALAIVIARYFRPGEYSEYR